MTGTDQSGPTGRLASEPSGHYHDGSYYRDDECQCEMLESGGPVRRNCPSCDHALFAVMYDPRAQASHVECASCGRVMFL